MLQSQFINAVETLFEGAIQVNYFNSDNGLRAIMFNDVGEVLGELVRSGCVPTVYEANMPSLVKIKAVPYTILQPIFSNMEFIFPIPEIFGKRVTEPSMNTPRRYGRSIDDSCWRWAGDRPLAIPCDRAIKYTIRLKVAREARSYFSLWQ